MSNKTLNLTDSLYEYLLRVSLRETDIQKQCREETAKIPGAEMQISPEQGQLMQLLVELIGARKTLEIGVFTGYSSLAVALALSEEGKIIACDMNEKALEFAQKYWRLAKVDHKIDCRIAPALKTIKTLLENNEAGSFDFVFIDADKENYKNYYEHSLTLLRKGGLILIDNTLWGGDVVDPSISDSSTNAIRALNEFLLNDERITLSLLPVGDGLTLARKR